MGVPQSSQPPAKFLWGERQQTGARSSGDSTSRAIAEGINRSARVSPTSESGEEGQGLSARGDQEIGGVRPRRRQATAVGSASGTGGGRGGRGTETKPYSVGQARCGNVARSRCPFQCCKACCYKAQNPCHIHVLKQSNTLPDKPSPATAPVSEQPSTNLPATSSASRLACLQRLPHHFLNSLRTKKSIAKKDVASINKWRFMKLKEHMQGDIDAENEAYERYTQNVGLLEETFCPTEDSAAEAEVASEDEERMDLLVSEAKVRLKSDTENADSFRERVATILDQKLKKLREAQSSYEDDKPSDENQDDDYTIPVKFTAKQKMERATKFNELLGKMTRARNEYDLKPCRDLMEQLFAKEVLFRQDIGSSTDKSNAMEMEPPSNQESTAAAAQPHSLPKLCTRIEVGEDFASKVDAEFSSLSEVAQL